MSGLIFNERSIELAPNPAKARAWIETFAELLACIEERCTGSAGNLPPAERLIPELRFSEAIYSTPVLPSCPYYIFLCNHPDPDERGKILRWLDRGEYLEQSGTLQGLNPVDTALHGAGICLAEQERQFTLSLASPSGIPERLPAPSGPVLNVATADVWENHLPELAQSRCLRRNYENTGQHNPHSGRFRGHGSQTSLLPSDAEPLYRQAIPEDFQATTWWARDAQGDYHRYQQHSTFTVHWNGSTAGPRAMRVADIPKKVRDALR